MDIIYTLDKKAIEGILALFIVLCFFLTACGENGTATSDSDTTETTEAFPSALAVASPLETVDSSELSTSAKTAHARIALSVSSRVPRYTKSTLEIDALLTGTSTAACTFDPELFLTPTTDADCYGPTVQYEDHPDYSGGAGSADGQLPLGDVGLWLADDDSSGHACAAAELNARMEGVQDKSDASLMGLATMICVINTNGYTMPSSSTLDLTIDMNALGIADTSFSSATLSHALDSSGDDVYFYVLELTYAPAPDSYDIEVTMDHIPGSTSGAYRGRMSTLINTARSGGNCHSSDITENVSLLYERSSTTDISVELHAADFCEHDSDGRVDGIVDPSDKYDSVSNRTGWSDTFNILTANYNPVNLVGSYTYRWQAGPQDEATRVFNLALELDSAGEQEGEAFYGYGADVEDSDGTIEGFICNWAGPNNDRSLEERVQHQSVSVDSTLGKVVADASDLLYAPVNGCNYDGSGTFTYDSDGDGVVDTAPTAAITNELLTVVDADADGTFDEITAAGFILPVPPTNF